MVHISAHSDDNDNDDDMNKFDRFENWLRDNGAQFDQVRGGGGCSIGGGWIILFQYRRLSIARIYPLSLSL